MKQLRQLLAASAFWTFSILLKKKASGDAPGSLQLPRLDALELYIRGLMAEYPDERHRLLSLAARLAPDYSRPKFFLGRLQFERKQCRAAIPWLEKVDKSDPDFLEARFLLGICYYQTGQFTRAASTFQQLYWQVSLPTIANNLAVVYSRLGNPQALELLQWALAQEPSEPTFRYNLAYELWVRGQFERCQKVLEPLVNQNGAETDKDAVDVFEMCRQGMPYWPTDPKLLPLRRLITQLRWLELAQRDSEENPPLEETNTAEEAKTPLL